MFADSEFSGKKGFWKSNSKLASRGDKGITWAMQQTYKMSALVLLLLLGSCLEGQEWTRQDLSQYKALGSGKSLSQCYPISVHLHNIGFSVPTLLGRKLNISPFNLNKATLPGRHTARIWISLVQLQSSAHFTTTVYWVLFRECFREMLLWILDEAPVRAAERGSHQETGLLELMPCKCKAALNEKEAARRYLSTVLSILQYTAYGRK